MNDPSSPLGVYGLARSMRVKLWLGIALLLLTAIGFVALVAFSPPVTPTSPETPQQRRMAEVAFLGLAALCVLGAIGIGRRMRRLGRMQLRVDSRGLTFRPPPSRHANDEETSIAWDAIESFTQQVVTVDYHGIPVGTRRRYTVLASDGRSIVLDESVDKVAALADRIATETATRLLPRMRQRIAQGQRVAFGDIAVVREGIVYRGATLPWARVERVEVDRYGAIVVAARDPSSRFLRVDYAAVPNAHVFVTLGQTMCR